MARRQSAASYRGYRTAGIRLREELLPELQMHRSENVAEAMPAIHAFDKAHLVMLIEEGLVPADDGLAMLRVLRESELEGTRLSSQGGLHSAEQLLIRRLGEDVGGQLHLDRSSGDLAEVGRRMTVRAALLRMLPRLSELRRVLLLRADEQAATIMPGYTQGQQAQPTTFGHWLSMWACVFGRDHSRLAELYRRVNQSPAGACILTGTDFPINRQRVAGLLGFEAVIPHTMDAILSHDVDLECTATLAILAANIGRLAADLMLWSSAEYAFIDIPDRFCGTSSIMMQKKNPYGPQEMKALAAEAIGAMVTAFMVEKDPTGTPAVERGRTERALWSVAGSAELRLREAADLMAALGVRADRMLESAGAHWAQATDVAGALVREHGISWRSAHQIVGILVRHSEEEGFGAQDTTPERLQKAAVEYMDQPLTLPEAVLAAALDPTRFAARRTLTGGPAPESARRELVGFRAQLEADEAFIDQARADTDRAARDLEQAIDTLARQNPAGRGSN